MAAFAADPASEHPDFLPVLAALRRSGEGFSLLLAECSSPALREKLLDALAKRCNRPLVRIDLSAHARDPKRVRPLDEIVAEALKDAPADAAVSLTGLEAGLSSEEPERAERTLQELNMRRSAFMRLGRPLLIWLPQHAMTLLARGAPDLHDWYSAAFVFASGEERQPLEYKMLDWSGGMANNLTAEEKRRHLETLESLLATAREAGDIRAQASILYDQGGLQASLGDYDAAMVHFQEAFEALIQTGDEKASAVTQGKIADILFARGQLDEALRIRTEQELPIYEKLGDKLSVAVTQGQIADILQARGQLDEALRIRTEQELPVYEKLDDMRSIAVTQGQIADILFARGQLDEALRIRTEQELPVYEKLGDVRSTAVTQGNIADILQARGNLDEALRIRKEKELPVFEKLGDVRSTAVTKGKIADILQARGQLDEALAQRQTALEQFQRLHDPEGIANCLWGIARIELEQQRFQEADGKIAQAYALVEKLGRMDAIAVIGTAFGQLLYGADHREEGLAVLRRSADGYRKLGREAKAQKVEALIEQLRAHNEPPPLPKQ